MSTIAPSYALTDRQRRIVACAREWITEHGEAPSMRELGAAVGLTSTSSVAYQLRRLRERMVVETRGRRSDRCPHCGK
ncbi:hypothetical protein [Streptomyces longhuiensis]|uniref:LexA family protein n=1 Tax=Streptomyces longhuiensis TaxID=2880933 RepID=UPI001D09A160|nr:hypothetical protein [Streptomyces longhuiensis]UDM05474.1 hypothetical protein LGI35_45285 [Streptomyces longhuiensis]